MVETAKNTTHSEKYTDNCVRYWNSGHLICMTYQSTLSFKFTNNFIVEYTISMLLVLLAHSLYCRKWLVVCLVLVSCYFVYTGKKLPPKQNGRLFLSLLVTWLVCCLATKRDTVVIQVHKKGIDPALPRGILCLRHYFTHFDRIF